MEWQCPSCRYVGVIEVVGAVIVGVFSFAAHVAVTLVVVRDGGSVVPVGIVVIEVAGCVGIGAVAAVLVVVVAIVCHRRCHHTCGCSC